MKRELIKVADEARDLARRNGMDRVASAIEQLKAHGTFADMLLDQERECSHRLRDQLAAVALVQNDMAAEIVGLQETRDQQLQTIVDLRKRLLSVEPAA